MSSSHRVTIDRAGRVVVPKALRDQLGITPGQPLEARVTDGHLEIAPQPLQVQLVEQDGLLIITTTETIPPLTSQSVRDVLDSVRR